MLPWNPEDPGHVFPEFEDLEIHPSETHSTCWGKIFHEEITPASGFRLPASCLQVPGYPLRLPSPCPWVWVPPPASRLSDLSCLRINGNLPLIRYQLGQEGVSLDPRKRGSIPIHMTSLKKKRNILLSKDIMNISKSYERGTTSTINIDF